MNSRSIVILAGGFGTRLKSELGEIPKSLAPVNNKPFLEYLLVNWIEQGFNNFIFCLHYQSNLIIDYVNTIRGSVLRNCNVQFVIETEPLGTGGACINAVQNAVIIEDYFFVANSDTFLSVKTNAELNKNRSIMTLFHVSDTSRFGRVEFSKETGLVTSMQEKSETILGSGYINAGFYKFCKRDFMRLNISSFSLENDILPDLIEDNIITYSILEGSFIDIGIPSDYKKFCRWVESNKSFTL